MTMPARTKREVRQPVMVQPKQPERVEERLKPEPCEDALATLRAKLPSLAAKAKTSPLSAIKLFCLDCSGCRTEVVACPSGGPACDGSPCPLWPFRLGKRPNGRVLTEEQRQAASDRARAMQSRRAEKLAGEEGEEGEEPEGGELEEDGEPEKPEVVSRVDTTAWVQTRRLPGS